MQKTMRRPYQIAGIVLILFAAFIARESLELKYYTTLGPGPGFFPFWLSVLMGVLAAIMFVQATFRQAEPMPDDFYGSRVGYLRALAVIVSFVWLVFTMEGIGFRISMAVFFAWLLLTLGRQKGVIGWIIMIGLTAAGSWGAFWLFNDVLKVILPLGPWGF